MGKYKLCSLLLLSCLLGNFVIYRILQYYNPPTIPISEWRKSLPPYPGETDANLFWFVQISDLHISRFYDKARASELLDFCTNTLANIKPDVVLVTGDLTDAKHRNKIGSEQYIDEWQTYDSVLRASKVTEKYIWLDIRGNHDAFNVLDTHHPSNYYMKYSGDKGQLTSQVYHHKKQFGTYSFIPIDATHIPGPKRPFNFIGRVTAEDMININKWTKESYNSNYTIWYGHFPSSSVTSESGNFREMLGRRGGVYLAGHLHDTGGLARQMHAMQPTGYLELELGDWKYNRRFRVMAVDHDMLSFTDTQYQQWPIIVITNPKAASYMIPRHEPIERMSHSTHIRFLIFHKLSIKHVQVFVDGKELPDQPYQFKHGPLWVCRWEPKHYLENTHELKVQVTDDLGEKHIKVEKFSLASSWQLNFNLFSVFILVTDFCSLFQIGHITATLLAISVLIEVKYELINLCGSFAKLKLLLKRNWVFYTVLAFWVNLLIGPWVVGEFIDGHFGITFPFGIYFNNKLTSEYILYVYGVIKVIMFYTPPLLYISHCNWIQKTKKHSFLHSLQNSKLLHMTMLLHTAIHFFWVLSLYKAYGLVAFLLSPSRLWWFLATFILFYQCWF